MKIVANNKYLKIIQLENEINIRIFKMRFREDLSIEESCKHFEKIDTEIFSLRTDYSLNGRVYPKGTLFYKSRWKVYCPIVKALENKEDWQVRINAQHRYKGSYRDILETNNKIEKAIREEFGSEKIRFS